MCSHNIGSLLTGYFQLLQQEIHDFIGIYIGKGYTTVITTCIKTCTQFLSLLCLELTTIICAEVISVFK